jgi:iron-sulfur cluster repair protein YtfE (RIC family)
MPGSGSEAAYAVYMMAEYGPEVIEEIQRLRHKTLDWTEFRDACQKFKALNKEMLEEKGFE